MRRPTFVTDEVYHVYNRGADKRNIFYNDADYTRFIYSIYKFNQTKNSRCRSNDYLTFQNPKSRGRASAFLVNVLYYSQMPNHFHVTLQQKIDGGIEKFMQKLGTGYAMYFNKKYDRKGVLFEGNFKAIHIDNEAYLMQISRYIHLNPLKLVEPDFKETGIRDIKRAKEFLRNYKWSSYQDFIGRKNFPFLVNNAFHEAYFKNSHEYEEFVFEGQKAEVEPRLF